MMGTMKQIKWRIGGQCHRVLGKEHHIHILQGIELSARLVASLNTEAPLVQALFPGAPKSVRVRCVIVLISARCQLDTDVSVCCEVSVGLVQAREWH